MGPEGSSGVEKELKNGVEYMRRYYIYQEENGSLLALVDPLVEGHEPGDTVEVEGSKTLTFLGEVEAKNSVELIQKIHKMFS